MMNLNVVRRALGVAVAVLVGSFFAVAGFCAGGGDHEGVARDLVLDEKYLLFPVDDEA